MGADAWVVKCDLRAEQSLACVKIRYEIGSLQSDIMEYLD